MKTIKSSKDITTLEVDDKVVFGDLKYIVTKNAYTKKYYLLANKEINNDKIFRILNINKRDFVEHLGSDADINVDFPETKSLEALTAIVSALFKEYEKQNALPKTWKEFCEKNRAKDEYYISNCSYIICVEGSRNPNTDKNLCISKQEAEAHLALMQLRQLRKAYVRNWEPDWISDIEPKYCVDLQANDFSIQCWHHINNPLSFPTEKLAEQFLTNFKDLLEIAKPFL